METGKKRGTDKKEKERNTKMFSWKNVNHENEINCSKDVLQNTVWNPMPTISPHLQTQAIP